MTAGVTRCARIAPGGGARLAPSHATTDWPLSSRPVSGRREYRTSGCRCLAPAVPFARSWWRSGGRIAAPEPGLGVAAFLAGWGRAVDQARGDGAVKVAVVSDRGEARAFMASSAPARMTAMAAGGAMCDYEGLVGDPGPAFDPRALLGALGVDRYDFSHVLARRAGVRAVRTRAAAVLDRRCAGWLRGLCRPAPAPPASRR